MMVEGDSQFVPGGQHYGDRKCEPGKGTESGALAALEGRRLLARRANAWNGAEFGVEALKGRQNTTTRHQPCRPASY